MTAEDGGPAIYLGRHVRQDADTPGGFRTGDITGGLRTESPEGFGSGSQAVKVGAILDIDVQLTWNQVPYQRGPSPDRFKLWFRLTDEASGQQAEVSLFGIGQYQSDPMMYDSKVGLSLVGDATYTFDLGGNRYDLAFATDPGVGDISFLTATVSPHAIVPNPEPATLALAAVGLAAAAGWRVRRRAG
ncbi:MAG: PEP-CTERM sorting domain-containing protein [Gemmataceae bacterium]